MSELSLSAREREGPASLSVFWPVAGTLVGVQVIIGLLAVALTAWFSYDRSLDLAAGSLRLRLDGLAEEVEQRADLGTTDLADLPLPVRLDLAARFPDPVTLVRPDGTPVLTVPPSPSVFPGVDTRAPVSDLPSEVAARLEEGVVIVQLTRGGPSWGLAPLYDRDGFLIGGLVVQPLDASVARELAGTRAAVRRALVVVAVLCGVIAVGLGALFTGRLVRPLQRITRQVERIGAGDYGTRLAPDQFAEFDRLSTAVNAMAAAVEESIERLHHTDRLRRELVANVGHDLRTPLAVLQGSIEEAGRYLRAGESPSARAALATAGQQAEYLGQLVADLFELSQLDHGPAPLHRAPTPLAELLHHAARAHRAGLEADGISFVTDIPADLPVLEADSVRLLRVLDNLLSNAHRHTPRGGRVELCARFDDEQALIQVRDTGSGMDAATLERVFERYYQGDDARTRGSGTGLGLPISRAIARAHSGDLTAVSTPEVGTVFTLRVPVEG